MTTGDTVTDWLRLGRRYGEIETAMIHAEKADLHGDEFRAEALRRLLEDRPGWVTEAEHVRVLEANRPVDRASGAKAKAELAVARAKYLAYMADATRECAKVLRHRAGTVPQKFRREGALMAAGWLESMADNADANALADAAVTERAAVPVRGAR